jgi:hypothetical protein
MARRTQENVLAEMLEKVLAYNIFQIIRLRKKLSEPEEMERARSAVVKESNTMSSRVKQSMATLT